ncbi:MAG: type VI secretion system Vgr family protein, partial [Caldimonas sp.]
MNLVSGLSLRAFASNVASRLDFEALLDQRGRMLKVETALPSLALIPERMTMREHVDKPFELVIDCLSTSVRFELKLLIGEQITVSLLHADGSYRPWHGYVTRAAQLGSDGGLARYRLHASPWLSFLALRRDSFVFQDLTAQAIVEDVFKDYPQAHFRWDVSHTLRPRSLCCQFDETDLAFVTRLIAEEGLSYRFEHLADEDAGRADEAGSARHVLVIGDGAAKRPDLGNVRFARTHATANLDGQSDAVSTFSSARIAGANAVALAAWNYKAIVGTSAGDESSLEFGDMPRLEVYDGAGAYRYQDADHAEREASLRLAALELAYKRFEGVGSARVFGAGACFSLVDHPLYGANTTALNYAGAFAASRERPDNEFCIVAVEHHAANNLGMQAATLLGLTDIEQGSYLNHFEAVPAAAPLVRGFIRKPTAPGATTALVVGQSREPLTTDREHRVKVQFHWQRGERPNAGGLAHSSAIDTAGRAPGDETSGTWVRVGLPAAGANWGAVLTPRIGTEVAIAFIEGDIDRPVVTGQLYNGADTPPFSAGVDSGVNHPGVISGLHTQRLDEGGFNQWMLDDASGQLRMRLIADYAMSELNLGFLIQQSGASSQRGSWRGSGFETATQGWAGVHAAKGLLVSTTARTGTYGSADSTQMDANEALSQLRAASNLGQRIGTAAKTAGARELTSFGTGMSVPKLLDLFDPKNAGKHPASVNGQPALKANSREPGSDPVEAFASPLVVLDTPSAALLATEAGIAMFAGGDLSVVAQNDVQHTAAHTWSSVSGKNSSWYTHEGGIRAYAANGPVSLRAHTDALQIWADKEVSVISVNDEITITAQTKIELIAGRSSVTLEGSDIEFKTPGAFTTKGAFKAFL